MKWRELLTIVGREPVFHSSLLQAGTVDAADISRQLSRWASRGDLVQLRRGLYAFSEHLGLPRPHPFLAANRMKRGSYISLQSGLAFFGLIPEHVPRTTSVCTGRPQTVVTPLGEFIYRHIKTDLFFGFQAIDLGAGQSAFIALPEKALLDLLHLTPGSDDPEYIRGLRLQNLERLNPNRLLNLAERCRGAKLKRAARAVASCIKENASP